MKTRVVFFVIFSIISSTASPQVGIGTSNPQATLDVNGTVRINQLPVGTTNEISLTGTASSRSLNRTDLGANLIIIDNSLDTAPVSGTVGDFNLGPLAGGTINNLDLDLGSSGINSRATFIRVYGYLVSANIAGITGGVNGRHVSLYFSETAGVSILENSPLALPQNRILTAATSQLSISGEGFIDLVYDDDAGSDGLGRWIVIKFRS
ncbi:MAG: hypothetical protein K8F54_11640 [Altibacter sp.]|uniref:hypothetical protein n=1 Tax=Altibacter sp. TaxID=2024823 RepID=UPI001DB89CAB|nr:hypothetical protein [Altibacter sp.]MBZ0328252.1 hypothetical protein [Altibacter sp.]